MSKKNYKETYFQHDRYARQDPKIKSMLVHFRKESEDKAKAAVCVFWWIVEDMHIDDYPVDKLDVFADDYRCDVDFLKSILEDFELFRIENGCYISDRVLQNLKEQEEKSEKARVKANKRWKKKDDDAPTEEDLNLVNAIIQLYNAAFKKTQIVGKENRYKIYKINKENNLTLDVWQKVFSHARRGWDIKGENKKPTLKNILENWDSFASDDYFLAPDYEAIENEKKEKALEEERQKEKEKAQIQKDYEEYENEKKAICDAKSAIEFLNKHHKFPPVYLRNSSIVRNLMHQYKFTIEDIVAHRNRNEGVQ